MVFINNKYLHIIYSLFFIGSCCIISCHRNHIGNNGDVDKVDTLKVVTLYGPTSYFDYRGEIMGIDYENARRFAEDEGMAIEFKTMNNIQELISALKSGDAQLAAYPIPYISEYNAEVLHCGHQEISRQILVQREGEEKITDVTQLIGKEIYVGDHSKYHYRLENLNEELGGGIKIHPIDNDTIVSEDFLEMVATGQIDYAVVDSEMAYLYKPAYPSLDLSLALSADQASSWAVAPGLDSLAAKIDRWENRTHSPEFIKSIYKRYYDRALTDAFDSNLSYFKSLDLAKNGKVSNYDDIFKKYSASSGYDWRLLAAIAFCESNYNPTIASRFGAFGLMQVMPSSAKAVGIDPSSLASPDNNVKAATRILKKLESSFEKRIDDPEERMKFVIASYNSGLGHIFDAMALAEKMGLDPLKWTGNVGVAALMKSRPEYYNDPVVKHGYFRGRETVDFVDHVLSIQNYLKQNTKL